MITTVCKISYGSQTVPPIVPAVQGDTGRAISFEIADFTPPAGATATYFILKPSGEAIYNSATITDNSILCELTAQSLAEAGENRMQVRVLQGEDIVTSFEVILMVRTFLGDDAIQSGTEMNIFDQAVEQATEEFQTNAEQIVEEVIESIPADYTELTEEVDELNERMDNIVPGLSDEAKAALLACFAHVEWTVTNGQNYYDALEEVLNKGTPSLLPEGYTQVNYLESTGTQYITTNILSQIPLEMRAKVAGTVSDQAPLIGAIDTSDTNNSRFFMLGLSRCTGQVITDETWCARYGAEKFYDEVDDFNNATWIKTHNPVTLNTSYNVVSGIKQSNTEGKSTCYIRDGYGEYSKDLNAPSPLGTPIRLFIKPTSMSPASLRLYNIQFYIGNMLIFNGIPAIRDSGQKPGLYDIIGDTFYTNEGTGEFIYG